MVIETNAVVEPAEFAAVTVKVVGGKADVGVPEIAPVPVEKDKPVELIEGEMEYEETVPPCDVGVFGVIAAPMV
jgi:hypothetical protein